MPRGGSAQMWGFEKFIHKVKIFVHTPLFRKISSSCSTVFTFNCSHSITVNIYILHTIYTSLKITKNSEKKREKPPLLVLPFMFKHFEGGGGDRCSLWLCAPAPTHASHPCSHPFRFCIRPIPACVPARGRSRPFLSARFYLLPGCTLGCSIHGPCTLIRVYPCSLFFLAAIVRARLSSAPIRRLSLSAVGVRLSFAPILTYWPCTPLAVRSIGCVHSFGSVFVCARTRFHPHPLSFLPANMYTCTYLLPMRTLTCLCSCSAPLSMCARAHCCWLEYLGLPIIHN